MTHERSAEVMRTAPIPKLLLTMGLPMMLSLIAQAFYNIIDSFFVSRMQQGEAALNALAIAFPVQVLIISVGVGTGLGANSILARSLGGKDKQKASLIAGNAIILAVFTYLVFLIFGIFAVNWYLKTQTNDPLILSLGNKYLSICTMLSAGCVLYTVYEKLLQATGKTKHAAIAEVSGVLTNIVLDPILIFGLLGCPKLGVTGAAYASVTGQFVSLCIAMYFHHRNNPDLIVRLKYFVPRIKVIADIYRIGFPAIIMQALMSFMIFGTNIILERISGNAVTAYGIYYKIQLFVMLAATGMNNALIPVVAFNYGAKDKERTLAGIRYGTLYIVIIMLLGAAVFQIFARKLPAVFDLSGATRTLCTSAFRIITIGYIFAGVNLSLQGVFQALGRGVRSLIIALLRLLVIVLPAAYIFTLFSGAQILVWAAFPIAEFIAFVVGILMYREIRDKR